MATINVISPNKRLGAHVSVGKTLYETLLMNGGIFTFQIYLGSPRAYNHRILSPEDIAISKAYCEVYQKTFYVHAACIVHLAQPKDKQPVILSYLNSNLKQLIELPASLIVHIGKGAGANTSQVVDLLKQVPIIYLGSQSKVGLTAVGTTVRHKLVLENAAGQGNEIGKNWQELYAIFSQLPESIGLCIDTQHAFAAGMVDFRSVQEVERFFKIIDVFFPGRLQCIHLNDSETPFGSRVDRHGGTGLRRGYIWSQDDSALKALLSEGYKRGIDFIMEMGNMSIDMNLLYDQYYNL